VRGPRCSQRLRNFALLNQGFLQDAIREGREECLATFPCSQRDGSFLIQGETKENNRESNSRVGNFSPPTTIFALIAL